MTANYPNRPEVILCEKNNYSRRMRCAVILGGTFGAYKINESRKSKKAVAKVTPVSLMTDSYWGDQLELSGVITSGNVQKVMLDNQKAC